VALFLDFNGGEYDSSSLGSIDYEGYNRVGSPDDFDATEQHDIIQCWEYVRPHFSMFDVNITTSDAARQRVGKWGWIMISEGIDGGQGSTSRSAIATPPYAVVRSGPSAIRPEENGGVDDKCRRVTHELGHNFTLAHTGVWEQNEFYKWEDWDDWDGVYGTIMAGDGKGQTNGWSYGQYSKDKSNKKAGKQDTMQVIRDRLKDVGGSETGWKVTDFSDVAPVPLCQERNNVLYRFGVLENPDHRDIFWLRWAGGKLILTRGPVGVSVAIIKIGFKKIPDDHAFLVPFHVDYTLPMGLYELHVTKQKEQAQCTMTCPENLKIPSIS